MSSQEPHPSTELTSEQLFGLLASLPEDPSADHDKSKRRCSRWLLTAPAELHFSGPAGASASEVVDIRDISLMGIGLICKAPVPPGSRAALVLPLEQGRYKADLHVAHCTPSPEGYRVGCRLLLPDMPAIIPPIDPDAIPEDDPDVVAL